MLLRLAFIQNICAKGHYNFSKACNEEATSRTTMLASLSRESDTSCGQRFPIMPATERFLQHNRPADGAGPGGSPLTTVGCFTIACIWLARQTVGDPARPGPASQPPRARRRRELHKDIGKDKFRSLFF